jgi:hypothetical protein
MNKYFLDIKDSNKIDLMFGEIVKERDGEIIAKGVMYSMRDNLRKPVKLGNNITSIFYNSFDNFDDLLEFVENYYKTRMNNSINNLKDSRLMYENGFDKNIYGYISALNDIQGRVNIQKKDYKYIKVLSDIAIQIGAIEDYSDFTIVFNHYNMFVSCNGKEYNIRYDKWGLIDLDEFYNYLVKDLNVGQEKL